MRVRFSLRAIQDLNAIADYIRLRNPAAALKGAPPSWRRSTLTLFPCAGRMQATKGVRKLVVPKYLTSSISPSIKLPNRSESSPGARRREYQDS